MGKDCSPKIRQRTDLSRKRARRAGYERLLIVCEGSKTEPNYFKEIRQAYRLHTANVVIHPSKLGTAPIQVLQYAKELFEHGNAHMQIKARAFEQVYVVFDRDDHDSYFDALRIAHSLTQDKLNIAYRRAQLLSEQNSALNGSFPYTDIGKLVTVLTKLKA